MYNKTTRSRELGSIFTTKFKYTIVYTKKVLYEKGGGNKTEQMTIRNNSNPYKNNPYIKIKAYKQQYIYSDMSRLL